jgi:stage III sporulation protein SpoIIIAA
VVDSNMELGGDGLIPHPALGSARRMQVGIRTYRALLRLAAIPA